MALVGTAIGDHAAVQGLCITDPVSCSHDWGGEQLFQLQQVVRGKGVKHYPCTHATS